MTHIYQALLKCPDIAPPPQKDQFRFVDDEELREDLARDTSSVVVAAREAQWKAGTVLGGAVVEALLFWALRKQNDSDVQEAANRAVQNKKMKAVPKRPIVDWVLYQYIPVAQEMNLISERTTGLCNAAREFRNLIHPGVTERTATTCDNATAYAALAAVYAVSNDLERAILRSAPGGTAAPS